jgi:hypothetical protein
MKAQQLLQEIADYCRHAGLSESTFGRRAVNDGKLTARLREGGRITTDTVERIRTFMDDNRGVSPASRPRRHIRPQREPMASATRSATSVSSTTGRNIFCSSIPAAKSG